MLSLLALVLSAAPLVVVDASFTGFEQELSARAETDLGKKGWNDCGYAGLTGAVATFQVPQPVEGLEFDANGDGVLLKDDGKHVCFAAGQKMTFAGAGTRTVFLIDRRAAGGARATVRLFSRAQSQARVDAALASMLHLTLDGTGPNPRYGAVVESKPIAVREANVPCAGTSARLLNPLAVLVVAQASTFSLASNPGRTLFVRTADACLVINDQKRFELSPGTATVWMEPDLRNPNVYDSRPLFDPKLAELAVFDTERASVFEDAPKYPVSALPLVVRTQSNDEQRWVPPQLCLKGHGGEEGSGCKQGRRAPSFYVSLSKNLEELFVSTRLGEQVTLQFVGPGVPSCELGDNVRTCDAGLARLPRPKAGLLAVWVRAAGPAQDVVVSFDARDEVSRLWTTGVPSEALPLEERVVALHFPFWGHDGRSTSDDRHDTLSLFAAAPAGLFVFVSKPLEGLAENQPFLAQRVHGGKVELVSLTGEERTVRRDLVTLAVPATLSFPELPVLTPAKTVDEALGLAGPDEQKLVEAYLARESAHNACVGTWMEKHDPTWGKSYELVNVRTGRTLSSTLFKQADAGCGLPKLEKATSAFIAAINGAQKKLRGGIVAQLKKKLGV